MTQARVLDAYFDKGLLQLNGNDAWFEKITAAADALAVELRAHPQRLVSYTYSALDRRELDNDPARNQALEILKNTWRTFSSVSMGPLDMVLRGVILDAVVRSCEADEHVHLTVALLLSSAVPHIEFNAEADVWKELLKELTDKVQEDAEIQWSVPGRVSLPEMGTDGSSSLTGRVGGVKVDLDALTAGIEAAAGPNNSAGEATQGNPHWPNAAQNWSHEFSSHAAKAIGDAVSAAAGARNVAIKSDAVLGLVRDSVHKYMEQVAGQLVSASQGVDLRSRLLWWKEALVSPSAKVEYRELDPSLATVLMALDYQKMLPALAPVSVTAFLRQSIRSVVGERPQKTLAEHLETLAGASELNEFRTDAAETEIGLRPIVSLVKSAEPFDSIETKTVYSDKTPLSFTDLGSLVFLESQALKAAAGVEKIEPSPIEENEEDDNAMEGES